jgi:hypothetical protein
MVNNIEELKKLIIWAKEQKIKVLKLADIHIEISDLALVESLTHEAMGESALESQVKQTHTEEQQSSKEDEEALYWSTR